METTVNNGMCRCCASEGAFKDVKTTYHWMGEEEVYADMLRDCFDINLHVSEQGEDGGICEVCITQLRNAINFKKQVLHTEDQFKKHILNRTMFRPNIVKLEVQHDDSDDNNASGDDEEFPAEFEIPIKTEESDELKPKKRSGKATMTTRSKKSKADNGETSTKRDNNHKKQNEPKEIVKYPNRNAKTRKEAREEFVKHQNNIQEILMCTNATPIRRVKDVAYACCYCEDQYHNPADLKKHCLEIHEDQKNPLIVQRQRNRKIVFCVKLDITGLQCKLCDSNIDSLEKLLDHLRLMHKKKIFTNIKNQIIPFKFEGEDLSCCICANVFEKFRKLQEHMHTHYRNFVCEECDLGFVNRGCLISHSAKHKLGTFKCNFCPKIFDTLRKQKSHEKSVHILVHFINKCGYCNERFSSNQKKDKHLMKVHGIKLQAIKCRACDKTFENKRAFTMHTRRDHLMERKHNCTECDKKFFSSSSLKMHLVKHSGVKEFKCDVCLKNYGRKKTLIEHMRIHLDDRRFKCEHCGQAFVQKCSWKGHMRNRHGKYV